MCHLLLVQFSMGYRKYWSGVSAGRCHDSELHADDDLLRKMSEQSAAKPSRVRVAANGHLVGSKSETVRPHNPERCLRCIFESHQKKKGREVQSG